MISASKIAFTFVALCLLVFAFPVASLAQGEDENPLNPEFSGPKPLVEYWDYTFGKNITIDSEGFSAAVAQSLMAGWSWHEIFEATTYSMFNQKAGTAGFYGCWFGYTAVSAGVSFFLGPAGPAFFFAGTTTSAILCGMRHFGSSSKKTQDSDIGLDGGNSN